MNNAQIIRTRLEVINQEHRRLKDQREYLEVE